MRSNDNFLPDIGKMLIAEFEEVYEMQSYYGDDHGDDQQKAAELAEFCHRWGHFFNIAIRILNGGSETSYRLPRKRRTNGGKAAKQTADTAA